MLHVVLYQPEIPHNTGAIGRLCLATGARLHLIHPLGFSLDDKHLKRVGLDYWHQVDVRQWQTWAELRAAETGRGSEWFYVECGGAQAHWDAKLTAEDLYLVFGPETRGIPASLMEAERILTIPMQADGTRSLNLATAAGIVMYEALRQRALAGIVS